MSLINKEPYITPEMMAAWDKNFEIAKVSKVLTSGNNFINLPDGFTYTNTFIISQHLYGSNLVRNYIFTLAACIIGSDNKLIVSPSVASQEGQTYEAVLMKLSS